MLKQWKRVSLLALIGMGSYTWGGVVEKEGIAVYTENTLKTSQSTIDFSTAVPMEKHLDTAAIEPEIIRESLFLYEKEKENFQTSSGNPGSGGEEFKYALPLTSTIGNKMEYGEKVDGYILPYTTSRVDMYPKINKTNFSRKFPFRASGQLFFSKGQRSHLCSAAMIKRGVLVTAAHCVTDYGSGKFFRQFLYLPARKQKTAPYGIWKAKKVYVLSSYFHGKQGECTQGVLCKNDIAVIVLSPKKGKYAGDLTGWFPYGINTYSYAKNTVAQITQLGYPASHDKATQMQRNDSCGIRVKRYKNNTIIGSRMTGGSSGGPWLVNFGQIAQLDYGVTVGQEAKSNVLVGVTSWGYGNNSYKIQGASQFTKQNIGKLVNMACKEDSRACR